MTKRHNWTTGANQTVHDSKTHRLAKDLIGNCPHLTPKTEAEIDNLMRLETAGDRNAPGIDAEMVSVPDPKVVAAMNAPEGDWMIEVEPTSAELLAIETEVE